MHNRYFIIDSTDANISDIEKVIIGTLAGQRRSLDGSLIVVKLPEGDWSSYDFLAKYGEFNEEEILEELRAERWVKIEAV